jgi:hypothetical protein
MSSFKVNFTGIGGFDPQMSVERAKIHQRSLAKISILNNVATAEKA